MRERDGKSIVRGEIKNADKFSLARPHILLPKVGTGIAPMGSTANCQATGLGPHFRVHCRISKGSKCWEIPHKSRHPVSAKLGMASRLVGVGVCS